MRLREVQWILRSAVKALDVASTNDRNVGAEKYTTVQNLAALKAGLESVGTLDVFRGRATKALTSIAFQFVRDTAEITTTERDTLLGHVQALANEVRLLLGILDQILAEENSHSFAYQLPPKNDLTLAQVQGQIKRVDDIFGQALRRLTNTEIRLRGFESGSSFLELVLRTVTEEGSAVKALIVVAVIHRAAKDFIEYRGKWARDTQEIKTLELKNELFKAQVKIAQAASDARLKALAAEVCKEAGGSDNSENTDVLVARSIKMLSEDLRHGARLQLPSNLPKPVADAAHPELLAPPQALRPAAEREPVAAQLTTGEHIEDGQTDDAGPEDSNVG